MFKDINFAKWRPKFNWNKKIIRWPCENTSWPWKCKFVAQKIIEKKLSVRQSENFVKIFKKKKGIYVKSNDANIQNLERSISDKIGLNVSIRIIKKNKGTITFIYHDIEQLNKIIDIIISIFLFF